jgi:hypothetical protein
LEPTEYPTIGDFYDADRTNRRRHSPEADFGVQWTEAGTRGWPRWRVSYIEHTGEVYAACQKSGPIGPVRLLGVVPVTPRSEGLPYYRELDAILDGWADPDVSGFDLAWITRTLTEHRNRTEGRQPVSDAPVHATPDEVLQGRRANQTTRRLIQTAISGGLRPHLQPDPPKKHAPKTPPPVYLVLLDYPSRDGLFGALHISATTGVVLRANLCHGNNGTERPYTDVADIRRELNAWWRDQHMTEKASR